MVLAAEVLKELGDLLLNFLVTKHLVVRVDHELMQKVFDFNILAEAEGRWVKVEADVVLREVVSERKQFKLEFLQDVVTQVQDPFLQSQRNILIVKVELSRAFIFAMP